MVRKFTVIATHFNGLQSPFFGNFVLQLLSYFSQSYDQVVSAEIA